MKFLGPGHNNDDCHILKDKIFRKQIKLNLKPQIAQSRISPQFPRIDWCDLGHMVLYDCYYRKKMTDQKGE